MRVGAREWVRGSGTEREGSGSETGTGIEREGSDGTSGSDGVSGSNSVRGIERDWE